METFLIINFGFTWLFLILNLLLALGLARKVNNALSIMPDVKFLPIGHQAPDFSAPTMNDKVISLSTYLGSGVALIFLSPHCEPCRNEIPRLEKLASKTKQFGGEMLLVSDSDARATQQLIPKGKAPFTVIVASNEHNSIFTDYRVKGTPSFYLLNPEGKIFASGMGLDGLEHGMERLFYSNDLKGGKV